MRLILGLNLFEKLLELSESHLRELRYLVDAQPYVDMTVSILGDTLSVNDDVSCIPFIVWNASSVVLETVLSKECDYHYQRLS
jgi:hypothetical protein